MKKLKQFFSRYMRRRYIHSQARSKTMDVITRKNLDSLDSVAQHLENLTEAQKSYKPNPDVWSAGEVIYHVANASKGITRISETLNNKQPMPGKMEESEVGRSKDGIPLEELKTEWSTTKEEVLKRLESLQEPLNLELTYGHPWFGELNAKEWLVVNYLHNRIHLKQIERIKASEGYPD